MLSDRDREVIITALSEAPESGTTQERAQAIAKIQTDALLPGLVATQEEISKRTNEAVRELVRQMRQLIATLTEEFGAFLSGREGDAVDGARELLMDVKRLDVRFEALERELG
jgi:hypothetical protein